MDSAFQPIDANLLGQFHVDGDRSAFSELHRRYVDFVYAAALRQCGDGAMAADVTQAVFLVLAKRAGSVRATALPAWLHRVTIYAVKNAQRAERRRRRHEQAAGIERLRFVMPTFSKANTNSGELELIQSLLDRAIASLPKRDRTIIIERYLCGRELGDVAAMVGASTAATQKRLERAVAKLRHYFRRHRLDIGAAGVPWPALQAAPVGATDLPSAAAATTNVLHLTGAVMRQLHWLKIGAFAVLAVTFSVGAAVVVEARHLAQPAAAPATQPDAKGTFAQVTEQAGANEVYLGGDVPRPGVYTLPSKSMTVGQLFASAGVTLQVGDHYSLTSRSSASTSQNEKTRATADAVVLRLGDAIMVSKAAAPVPADAKLDPFTDIRWNGDAPEILLNGTWYKWIGINQHSVNQLIQAAKNMDADQWQKRMGEDLVQVFNSANIYVGTQVDLDVQPLDGGPLKQLTHVPMTEENRRSVYLHRKEREGP
jgi:RNA polymerase sigma factor (sigma-70 family)